MWPPAGRWRRTRGTTATITSDLPSGTPSPEPGPTADIDIGSEVRIDVSSEAGRRFDQNVTGFRAEEEFAFNAEPYVRTGKFVKILGL